MNKQNAIITGKVSKYEIISDPYFPVFGLRPDITPYLDTSQAVYAIFISFKSHLYQKQGSPIFHLFG